MIRELHRVLWIVTVFAIGVSIAQEVMAQSEGGRGPRRGFPVSSVRLASAAEVQDALKLTDEQKPKVAEINEKLRDEIRDAFQGGGGFDQMQKLNDDASAKLSEVLDETQQKRLMGITVQANGPGALVEPVVMTELKLTDEQKAKLAEIRQAGIESFRKVFQEAQGQNLSREEMRAKFDELRDDTDEKMLAVLTPEQKTQLESLKGEPVEIDYSQFRFGGGGGGNDRGGQDQDSEKNQDDAKAGSDQPAPSNN